MIEFNPKGGSILDQQLSTSGLAMDIVIAPAVAMAGISTLIGAGTSIFGSINASNAASSQANFQQQQAAISSQHAYDVAIATNAYLTQQDANDQANYQLERDFAYKSLMKDWRYGKRLHKFEQLNQMQEWRKNRRLGRRQLKLNAKAEQYAIEAEQGAIADAFLQHQFQSVANGAALQQTMFEAQMAAQGAALSLNKSLFDAAIATKTAKSNLDKSMFEGQIAIKQQGIRLEGIKDRQAYGQLAVQENINQLMEQNALQKETAMVDGLLAQGRAELAQAGKSREKGLLSNTLALGRSLRALDSELSGRYKQAAIQMAELNADSSLQIASVGLEGKRTRGMMEFAQQEYALTSQQIAGNVDFAQQEYALTQERIGGMISFAQDEYAFNSLVLEANLSSSISQANRNIKDIMLDRKFADLDVEANMYDKPSKLPYQPKPILPPERIFLERMQLVVPEVSKYKNSTDKLKKLLSQQGSLPGGKPGSGGGGSDTSKKPYKDEKGKIKKGFKQRYVKGQLYYYNSKTGESFKA